MQARASGAHCTLNRSSKRSRGRSIPAGGKPFPNRINHEGKPMDRSREFAGRAAFVTGAGTGIGAAVARELASRGAAVAIFGRRAARLEETAEAIRADGGKVLVVVGNVANAENVENAIQRTVAEFGGLHFAVNN